MKENALGECQACDLNREDMVNCKQCELTFNNECLECGLFTTDVSVDTPLFCDVQATQNLQ